jgi:anti-sigma B factor antagonist
MELARDGDWPLSIELFQIGRRIVLAVAGEVDVASVDELKAAVEEAEGAQPLELWIDLSRVSFMDSTGLTTLLLAHRRLDDRLSLICPDGTVRRLLELAGVDRVMAVYDSRAAAQAAS